MLVLAARRHKICAGYAGILFTEFGLGKSKLVETRSRSDTDPTAPALQAVTATSCLTNAHQYSPTVEFVVMSSEVDTVFYETQSNAAGSFDFTSLRAGLLRC